MRHAHTVVEVRAAEAAVMAGLPEGALMQRAAAGLARTCAGLLGGSYGRRVVLLAGSGNNGGDALYAGALLARRGARVDALRLGSRLHEGGRAALLAAGGRIAADASVIDVADLVVDGIVGIGGRGGLRDDAGEVAARAAGSGAVVVAVDIPSGVDADTGEVVGAAVRADVTVTFGTHKPGLLVDPGASHCGVVELVDIGLGPVLPPARVKALQSADIDAALPPPPPESDKYRRGVVGLVAGSDTYPGAAVLCAGGALRGGVGMVRYVGPERAGDLVLRRWPEVVVGTGRVQAWVVGSGLGDSPESVERAREALGSGLPAVVDADGLRHAEPHRAAPTLLTPHAGELARLLGADRADVEAHRLHWARVAAERWGAAVLLKGSTTVVAAPDGAARVNPTGTSWLATAGSGDVLAGLAGALLARGLEPFDAGSVAAWLHGLAARIAADGAPITPVDVLEALPAARRRVAGARGADLRG